MTPSPFQALGRTKQAGWAQNLELAGDLGAGAVSLIPGIGGAIGAGYYGLKGGYHALRGNNKKALGNMAMAGASFIPGAAMAKGVGAATKGISAVAKGTRAAKGISTAAKGGKAVGAAPKGLWGNTKNLFNQGADKALNTGLARGGAQAVQRANAAPSMQKFMGAQHAVAKPMGRATNPALVGTGLTGGAIAASGDSAPSGLIPQNDPRSDRFVNPYVKQFQQQPGFSGTRRY